MVQEQVNPNALAAPAEGFGQTVSFAFDPRGDVPTVQPITSQPRGMGVSGGLNARLSDPRAGYAEPTERDATGALLMKVGEEMLSKKLDEQRTTKFVEGMQRAMSGEAVTEVIQSTPWYAKLFGDTPAIEGARAYTAASKVNEQVSKQVAGMPSIQTLDTAAAAKHFAGVINQSLTGDPGTDNVIMKGMTEQLPALMKAQAKAHYGYTQKQAMTALSRNIETGAKGLQAYGQLYAEDKVTEADMDKMAQSYITSIMPPDGIDEENYTKTLTGNMRLMAATGQFHALAALKRSGVMQALTPEQAGQVEAATMGAANKARDNYAFKYAREIAEITSDAAHPPEGSTPAQIAERIDGMNAKYQKLTGSPVGLFSSDQKADMIKGTFNAIKAEIQRADRLTAVASNKAATVAQKEQAAAELDAVVEQQVGLGNVGALKLMKGVTDDMIDLKVVTKYKQDPKAGGDMLANLWFKNDYINKVIQNEMLMPLRNSDGNGPPTDGWFASVAKFNELKQSTGGLAYASAYYGDYAKKMERASRMLGDRVFDHPDAARIFEATMGGTWAQKPDKMTDKERKAAISAVTDLNSNFVVRKFTGKTKLREDALATISDVAQENIEDWRGTDMSDTEAVQQGVAAAVNSSRLELIGGFAIRNADVRNGKKPKSLRELASTATNMVPAGNEDAYFEEFLHQGLKIAHTGSVRIDRMGEVNGVERFRVSHKDNGEDKAYMFTSAMWQEFAAKNTVKDVGRGRNPWAFGPQLSPMLQNAPDMPYVYGSDANRAAVKAKLQAAENKKFKVTN